MSVCGNLTCSIWEIMFFLGVFCRNNQFIIVRCASIVKWYNVILVRFCPKFDSSWKQWREPRFPLSLSLSWCRSRGGCAGFPQEISCGNIVFGLCRSGTIFPTKSPKKWTNNVHQEMHYWLIRFKLHYQQLEPVYNIIRLLTGHEGFRPAPEHSIHLTCISLENIPKTKENLVLANSVVEYINNKISGSGSGSVVGLELQFEGYKLFSTKGNRLVLAYNPPTELQRWVSDGLKMFGITDRWEYHPHITLGKLNSADLSSIPTLPVMSPLRLTSVELT